MTLSILIPAYNPGVWLRRIMDNLTPQLEKYPDTEIIVVDDGSTEVLSYLTQYPHTRYIWQTNRGEPTARNRLMDEAQGEYIQFIDADDEVYSNALDVIYDNINSGYDFVTYEYETDHDRTRAYHNYGQLMLNCAMWGYTFRKSIFGNERFNERMLTGCDVDILLRVLREDHKHKHDDRIWYNYRWNGNEQSLCHKHLRGEI